MNLSINLNMYQELKKIDPMKLNNELERIFNTGYNYLYPKNIISHDISSLNQIEIINKLNQLTTSSNSDAVIDKVEQLKSIISKLLGISYTSNKKGEMSENTIEEIIKTRYNNLTYQTTRHIPHSGDAWVLFDSGQKLMVEVKNYTKSVPTNEIIKFNNDMINHNIKWGIFLSINSRIPKCKTLDYKQFIHNNDKYHQIFISNLFTDISRLDLAFTIFEKLYQTIPKKNIFILQAEKQINQQLFLLDEVWQKNYKLRQQFNLMETNIKQTMNNYYTGLREFQFSVEKCLKKTSDNISGIFSKIKDNKKIKQTILEQYRKEKIFIPLSKLIDIFINKDYLIQNKDKSYQIYFHSDHIANLKIVKKKITLSLLKPTLNLFFGSNTPVSNSMNFDIINNFKTNIWT